MHDQYGRLEEIAVVFRSICDVRHHQLRVHTSSPLLVPCIELA